MGPTVNACLNGACTLLLIAGYVTIKRQQVAVHKTCMLSALGVSAVFLASYLYSHIDLATMRWLSTPFTGPAGVKPVYYVILISHIGLAVVIVPLAMFTAWQGIRNRLDRHVRIARWTLPIWLYVSITGVVVYVMLYQLYPSGAGMSRMPGE